MKNINNQSEYIYSITPQNIELMNFWIDKFSNNLGLKTKLIFLYDVKNDNVAWVLDDVSNKNFTTTKNIYINIPSLSKLFINRTNRVRKYDELLQLSMHELGHIYENACLKYRGPKIQSSKDFQKIGGTKIFMPLQKVSDHFDNLFGNNLIDKRDILAKNPLYHNFENKIRDVYVDNSSFDIARGFNDLKSTVIDVNKNIYWYMDNMDYRTSKIKIQQNDGSYIDQKLNTPKHIQFIDAILRNNVVVDEKLILDKDVQTKLDYNNMHNQYIKNNIISCAIDTDLDFHLRLPYIFYLFDIYQSFYNQDKQDFENKPNFQQEGDKANGEGDKANGEGDKANGEGDKANGEGDKANGEGDKANGEGDKANGEGDKANGEGDKANGEGDKANGESSSKNNFTNTLDDSDTGSKDKSRQISWEEYIDDLNQRDNGAPHLMQDMLGDETEVLEEDFVRQIEEQDIENNKSEAQKKAEQQIKDSFPNLDPKSEEFSENLKHLLQYSKLLQQIHNLPGKNGKSFVDYVTEDIFSQIVSNREIKLTGYTGPVLYDQSDGDLDQEYIYDTYMDLKGYNGPQNRNILENERRQKNHEYIKSKNIATGFHMIIITDGTASMSDYDGTKNKDQKLSTLAIMHSLSILSDKMQESDSGIDPAKYLHITHEGRMHAGHNNVYQRKQNNSNRGTKEILDAMKALDDTKGRNTYIHQALQKIYDNFLNLDSQYQSDVQSGKQKYIILTLSDGQTNEPESVTDYISKLRELGCNVNGIGITQDGNNMTQLFTPTEEYKGLGIVCHDPHDLSQVIADVIISGLENIDHMSDDN